MTTYIVELRPYDVLLGRGSGPNDHEGNIRFRKMVAERKSEYMATNHRLTKAKIAQEIVDAVLNCGGRFLRKLENDEAQSHGVPDGVDAYILATDDTIMEKAKQALRQNTNKNKTDEVKPKTETRAPVVTAVAPMRLSGASQAAGSMAPLGARDFRAGYRDDDDFEPIPLSKSPYRPKHTSVTSAVAMPPPPVIATSLNPQWNGAPVSPSRVGAGPTPQRTVASQQGPSRPVQEVSGVHDSESILSHLPPSVLAQYNHQLQQQPRAEDSNDMSMSNIPLDEPNNRRFSMTMTELAYHHGRRMQPSQPSMNMSEDMMMSGMMDSFSKTKVSDEARNRFYASTETMGTIEPIGIGSMADMSVAALDSSTFSFFRGNESIFASTTEKSPPQPSRDISDHGVRPGTSPPSVPSTAPTAQGMPRWTGEHSYTIHDLPKRRPKDPPRALTGTIYEDGVASNDTLNSSLGMPRPVGMIEDHPDVLELGTMGSSSMSILKSVFASSGELDMPLSSHSTDFRREANQGSSKKNQHQNF